MTKNKDKYRLNGHPVDDEKAYIKTEYNLEC